MKKTFLLFLIGAGLFAIMHGASSSGSEKLFIDSIYRQDTLQKLQILYRGVTWTNKYRRFTGDQFFGTQLFVPGTVSIDGHTFKNLRLKFDIYSDEVIIPLNREEIIQLNREMIDSFSLTVDNKTYTFLNFQNDTVSGLSGYCNLLCSGKASLYVKYIKTISTAVTEQSDGEFNQIYKVFLVRNGIISLIKSKNDMINVLGDKKPQLNEFIKKNRIRISRFDPGSFLPVIMYYNSIQD
jgi:hypothetical protein